MGTGTGFPELDALLDDLVASAREALDETYVGTYLQGSFALGAGDAQSDADFVVVTSIPPSGDREARVRELHAEIVTRPGVWSINIEGSYADANSLRTVSRLDVAWLYVDRGQPDMTWDRHCNTLWTRWILRRHGIALDGPPPDTLVDDVPADDLRVSARESLPRIVHDTAQWADMDDAWTQKFVVETCCRALHTAITGDVISKAGALSWALGNLEREWHPLLIQVSEDRRRPWRAGERPRPGSMDRALAFAGHVGTWTPPGT